MTLVTLIVLLFAPALAEAGDVRETPFQATPRQTNETAAVPTKEVVCLFPEDEEALWFTKWEGIFWNRDYPTWRGTVSVLLAPSWTDGSKHTAATVAYVFPDSKKTLVTTYVKILDCKLRIEYTDKTNTYSLEKRGDQFVLERFDWWGPKRQFPIRIELKHIDAPPYLPFKLVRPVPEISETPASQPSTAEITQ
jgi:hypothetical protein